MHTELNIPLARTVGVKTACIQRGKLSILFARTFFSR